MMIELQQAVRAITDYWYGSSEDIYQEMGRFLQENTALSVDQIQEKMKTLYEAAARDHGWDDS